MRKLKLAGLCCSAMLTASALTTCSTAKIDRKSALEELKKRNIPEKPHVLFVAIDDLRDWTGYLEAYSNVKTPNLDKIASMGVNFSNAHCPAPVCCPSRSSLLLGLKPSTTGIYENSSDWPKKYQKAETLTLSFKKAGYYVGGSGKIYHGQGNMPYWDEFQYGKYSPIPENPEFPGAFGNPLDIPDEETGDHGRIDYALDILNYHQEEMLDERPLFLACGLIRPHMPFNVPRRYFDMYPLEDIKLPPYLADDLADIPEVGKKIALRESENHYAGEYSNSWSHEKVKEAGHWKRNIQAYLASITYADYQFGRLLKAWEESPYAETGVIVLWGDHGWHFGEKDHWSKRTLWEVGTRTPFLFYVPGLTKAGSECKAPVSLLDIYPTLRDLCNLKVEKELEGSSLLPQLIDPEQKRENGAVTVWGKGNYSVKSDTFRLIHYFDGSEELYDHTKDPDEWKNLIDDPQYKEIADKLRADGPSEFADFAPLLKNKKGEKRPSWFLDTFGEEIGSIQKK